MFPVERRYSMKTEHFMIQGSGKTPLCAVIWQPAQNVKAVLQITEHSRVHCDGKTVSDCGKGMCVLLGFREGDSTEEADRMIDKILKMRIFADEKGKLNLSSLQIGADLLVISNFTLYANCASRRPDFLQAMKFAPAKELYEYFLNTMQKQADLLAESNAPRVRVFPGVFGGDMKVEILNDGPITIVLDSEDF